MSSQCLDYLDPAFYVNSSKMFIFQPFLYLSTQCACLQLKFLDPSVKHWDDKGGSTGMTRE
ncbi:hypothetical protein HCR18_06870 [Wolbachia pipientis]|uniref:hypothetical protein n=1 Tax=Wolbachia pipientis TaxID=955 RepID=UPI0015F82F86|nr:hypothetical protein [Wolbachia pipientis]MBA8758700.1 hypothetical protein [Wolbachia pipientis]